MPKLTRNGSFVDLVQPGMKVRLCPQWGGAPLEVTNLKNGVVTSNPMAGEGFQVVWDSGQDPTQASATGIDSYPLGDPYYAREEAFVVDGNGREALYQVGGIAPYFWGSYEPLDDCIPPDGDKDHGWSTRYHNHLGLPESHYMQNGLPIYFAPKPGVQSGILLLGDEIIGTYYPAYRWHQRVCKTAGGSISFRMRISFKDAPNDGVAGVYFKLKHDYDGSDSMHSVYAAPKCALYVNKFGGVNFYNNGPTFSLQTTAASQNSDAGMLLEVRSYSDGTLNIFVDGKYKGTYTAGYKGEAFGLFGTCSSGRIKFHYREVFDAGTLFSAQYRSTPRNTLWQQLTVYRAWPPYELKMYRLNLPVAFTNPSIRQASYAWTPNKEETGGIVSFAGTRAVYAGRRDGSAGLFCRLHSYSSEPGYLGHIGLDPAHIAVNNLTYGANFTPEEMSGHTTITEWAPEIREDLL